MKAATSGAIHARIDHVAVSVSDLERSAEFYSRLLGFSIREHAFTLPGGAVRGLVLRDPHGLRLELFENPHSEPRPAPDPIGGTRVRGWFQFAIRVEEITTAYREALAAGGVAVRAPAIAPDGITRFAFIADPDGALIELITRVEPAG